MNLNQTLTLNQIMYEAIINNPEKFEANLDAIIDHVIETNRSEDSKQFGAIKFMLMALSDSILWSHLNGLKVNILSQIPLSSGLGSSASFSVCLAMFFLILANKIQPRAVHLDTVDLELINKYAFYIEKLFHGRTSGIDNTTATFGKYILLDNGHVTKFCSSLELPILIVNSGVPKKTFEQVKKVRGLYERHTKMVENILDSINCLVEEVFDILSLNKELLELSILISINHQLLCSLQVSSEELNQIVNLAHLNGGFS